MHKDTRLPSVKFVLVGIESGGTIRSVLVGIEPRELSVCFGGDRVDRTIYRSSLVIDRTVFFFFFSFFKNIYF